MSDSSNISDAIGVLDFQREFEVFKGIVSKNNQISDTLRDIVTHDEWPLISKIFWAFEFGYLVAADRLAPVGCVDPDSTRGYQ